MTTISTILISAFSKIANKAVADAYQTLKDYLSEKFGKDNEANEKIEELKASPQSEQAQQAVDRLATESKLAQDAHFQSLLNALAEKTEQANIQVNISGSANVKGVVGAGSVTVGSMSFGE